MFQLTILLYILSICECSHILLVFPVPEKRHSVLSDSLVKLLLEDGHEVTYVTHFPRETEVHNLKYIDIRENEQKYENEWSNVENTENTLQMENIGLEHAQRALQHPNMRELIRNSTCFFDLVIAEWFYSGLLAPLSALYECPLIWYTPTDVSWKSLSLVNSDVSTFPAPPPGISIVDRVKRIWSQVTLIIRNYYHVSAKELPAYELCFRDAFQIRKQTLPNYENLVYNGSMLLINSQPVLTHTSALPLNAKHIGGHHLEDTVPPLPKNLKKLMDDSKDGVIYVDMETSLIRETARDHVAQAVMDALGRVKQTVIWKTDDSLVSLPRNIYTLKKPPQQGILGHANTITFISHGDLLSMMDAARHGVPVIGIPVMEHQMENVNTLAKRELVVKVEYDNDLSRKILDAVDTVTNDKSYRSKAKEARSILGYRLASPQEEFQFCVRNVINTGAKQLRSPSLQTSAFERYNLDIIVLLLMLLWFLTKVVKVVKVHLNNNDDLDKKDS